ncbi:hypothetical protein M6B38_162580 [Iris pallida]|uniref:Uncharacterized protein n=1 Tax=Iris pallida TaxID=29817 RepID=A0AAX6EZS1_IRIPA|nr:hypothetical protein M6B38_162580 [Iris pallida]
MKKLTSRIVSAVAWDDPVPISAGSEDVARSRTSADPSSKRRRTSVGAPVGDDPGNNGDSTAWWRDDLVAAVYVGSGATDGVGMTEGWRDRLGGSSSGAR